MRNLQLPGSDGLLLSRGSAPLQWRMVVQTPVFVEEAPLEWRAKPASDLDRSKSAFLLRQ
jgi:hypothetical protein